jgi:membrane protease YdiL (CAAX protease family)
MANSAGPFGRDRRYLVFVGDDRPASWGPSMDAAAISPATRLSRPLRPLAELVVVVGLLEAELWFLRANAPGWLNALAYGAIVLVAWLSHESRRRAGFVATFPTIGASRAWFEVFSACAILSAILMIAAGLVGDPNETFEYIFLDKPPLKLFQWVSGKFAAALVQQLALQLFLWPVCFEVTRARASGAILAATIFGLIHLPSPTLVAITSLAGVVWIFFYQRSGRLAPLVLSHMILATLAHGALPERLTFDMRVGSTAMADMKRFGELNDPRIRLINRRLKENRSSLKHFTSPQYFEAQGGTMPGFIRGLFRDILDQAATDSDVEFWMTRKLANPQVDIVNILLASDEYAQILEARRARLDGQPLRR